MRYPTDRSSPLKSRERYTYGDYRQWPDGERWELIDGLALVVRPEDL